MAYFSPAQLTSGMLMQTISCLYCDHLFRAPFLFCYPISTMLIDATNIYTNHKKSRGAMKDGTSLHCDSVSDIRRKELANEEHCCKKIVGKTNSDFCQCWVATAYLMPVSRISVDLMQVYIGVGWRNNVYRRGICVRTTEVCIFFLCCKYLCTY